MRPQGLIKGVIALVIIIALLAGTFAPIAFIKAAAPTETEIKTSVNQALWYLYRLVRDLDSSHSVISEYPSIPIAVKVTYSYAGSGATSTCMAVPGIFWRDYTIEVEAVSIGETQSTYKYKVKDGSITVLVIDVTEYHYYASGLPREIIDIYAHDSVFSYTREDGNGIIISEFVIYVNGGERLTLTPTSPSGSVNNIDIGCCPAFRTSVRHVEYLAKRVFSYSSDSALQTLASKIGNTIDDFFAQTFGSSSWDFYQAIFGDQHDPNPWDFWDAKTNPSTGRIYWYDLLDYMDSVQGLAKATGPYPIVPYKSKVTTVTADSFYYAMVTINDPLLNAVRGLYYFNKGEYDTAKQYYDQITFDGVGVYTTGQQAYSTVRLAVYLILASKLASIGMISWDRPDQVADILIQLQWQGSGHVKLDDGTILNMVLPFHKGGFLVGYDEIASYGFVQFRPGITDYLVSLGEAITGEHPMPEEYPGVVPTNAEATLLSLWALAIYCNLKYETPISEIIDL